MHNYPIIYLSIQKSQPHVLFSTFIFRFSHLKFLKLTSNNLTYLFFNQPINITQLDLSINLVSKLREKCFVPLNSVTDLSISRNILFMAYMKYKLLSKNKLQDLNKCAVLGLTTIRYLDLSLNNKISIEKDTFSDITLNVLFITSPIVCCLKINANTNCFTILHGSNFCKQLLETRAVQIVTWFVAIAEMLSNSLCIVCALWKTRHIEKKKNKNAYWHCVLSLGIANTFSSLTLFSLLSVNRYYGIEYPFRAHFWHKNPFCHMISFFSTFSNIVSPFTVNLLTFARYKVLKSPLNTKFKRKSFILKTSLTGFFLCFIVSISFMIVYLILSNFHQNAKYCIKIGFVSDNYVDYIITYTIVLL